MNLSRIERGKRVGRRKEKRRANIDMRLGFDVIWIHSTRKGEKKNLDEPGIAKGEAKYALTSQSADHLADLLRTNCILLCPPTQESSSICSFTNLLYIENRFLACLGLTCCSSFLSASP